MRSWICPVMLVLIMTCSAVGAMAQTEIWVQRVEAQGRLLVPIRGIFEALGAAVDWDPSLRMVKIDYLRDSIVMHVGDRNAFVSGAHYALDVAPRTGNGRVHVPLRFVGEAMGGQVDYAGNRVDITSPTGDWVRLHLSAGQAVRGGGGGGGGGSSWPWTSQRRVTNADLSGYSYWQLTLMRNEIYARHGRQFDNSHIRGHFNRQGWYRPSHHYRESHLNRLERDNAAAIRNYQTRQFGTPATRP